MTKIDIFVILNELGISFRQDGDCREINSVGPIGMASPDQLAFCAQSGETGTSSIMNSRAGVILCKSELYRKVHPRAGQLFLFVDNPRLLFVQILNRVNLNGNKSSTISSTAIISKNAKIGNGCNIGDFAIVGDNCRLGDHVYVAPHAVLVQNCDIGNNCVIQSGAILGSDGFAFERHEDGTLERFPHLGNVIIGENVEICANSSIARGSLSDTIIGADTKIDALVHVAHNVVIGKHCELTAGTVIGGSTTIGDSCWMGLNCTIKNKIKIGDHVIVASGASVINNVQAYDIVAGVPAKSIKNKVRTDELFLMAGQRHNKIPAA